MLHPLIRLLASHPQRLAEHAEAYGELLAIEARSASALWSWRLAWYGGVVVGLTAAMVLAGVAVMLWALPASAPLQATGVPLAFIVVPGVPALLALACLLALRRRSAGGGFEQLRRQLGADLALLRELSAP